MLTVIIGGSGSGKSEYAENYLLQRHLLQQKSQISQEKRLGKKELERNNNLIYIATMQPFGKEAEQKIKRHQLMRQEKNFTTIECYTGLAGVSLPDKAYVLLECMSNLTANEMFSEQGAKEHTLAEVLRGIDQLSHQAAELMVVTNNVFEDGYNYDRSTMEYLRILGEINVGISRRADQVIEVVHGIPIVLKQ
ncbi:MAG: bifunctional adenosylcobinamide kinase/adenosylcobinamide-phosphate guanylyltransferase [Mobilitalea sp.]